MIIINKTIDDLIPYARNPRKNDHAITQLASMIKEFGFKIPVIIKSDGSIIDGHLRLKAAKRLKMKEVPCIVADDWTEAQVKAFRIAVNKSSELAEWDMDLLKLEIEDLVHANFDIKITGFTADDFPDLLPEEIDKGKQDDMPKIEKDNPLGVTVGDVYQLGDHRLICGDSTQEDVVNKLFGDELADLIITDPPYGVSYNSARTIRALNHEILENDSIKNIYQFYKDFLGLAHEKSKEKTSIYLWFASIKIKDTILAFEDANFDYRSLLIWEKTNFSIEWSDYHWMHEPCLYGWKKGKIHNWYGDRTQTTILKYQQYNVDGNKLHPTMKPVDMIEKLIRNSSQANEIVYDPFGGSGTTMIACENSKRKCRMIELDPHYCSIIIKRWQDYTGREAVKS